MSSQLKQFIDWLGGLWAQGKLATKAYSGFVTSTSQHGGQESTLLARYNFIHHFGGVIASSGCTDPVKCADGNPYGPCHVDVQRSNAIGDQTRNAAHHQTARVVQIAGALKRGLAA